MLDNAQSSHVVVVNLARGVLFAPHERAASTIAQSA